MALACGLIEGIAAGQVIAGRANDADRLHDVALDQAVTRPRAAWALETLRKRFGCITRCRATCASCWL